MLEGDRQSVPPADPQRAYWLMHGLRALAPKRSFWRDAQFDTIRISLLKLSASITETATRIRFALPTG